MITIIDFQAGNLFNVQNALNQIGVKSIITSNPQDIIQAKKIIFPGVGAAGATMKNLQKLNLIEPIKNYIKSNRPFLGICLGAQILLSKSAENNTECLNIISGKNLKFKNKNLTVPHMGWNQVNIIRKNKLFTDIPSNCYFYFIHSYYLSPKEKISVISETDYGINFASALQINNLYAVQFHPEKSAKWGLKLLNNFCKLC